MADWDSDSLWGWLWRGMNYNRLIARWDFWYLESQGSPHWSWEWHSALVPRHMATSQLTGRSWPPHRSSDSWPRLLHFLGTPGSHEFPKFWRPGLPSYQTWCGVPGQLCDFGLMTESFWVLASLSAKWGSQHGLHTEVIKCRGTRKWIQHSRDYFPCFVFVRGRWWT